ncbi:MAG: hypothetical protein EOO66_21410 [Methylobacterium sp.]|nr:hypothetical protein FVA80_01465 [Methylobacterium sp. WL1]RZK86764.1 MAG: hypothetical protein EOO66_21410 [Methylobacterium sp.]TXN05948.1 hypothetical protein FV242_01910 [Methylobacterium sp. WL64]TXN59471.1 hypothetical protein FV241_02945 [Methylobacterium sp. WL2]
MAGPLSRAGEVCSRREPSEGCARSGETCPLTPTLFRTGEGARDGLHEQGLRTRGAYVGRGLHPASRRRAPAGPQPNGCRPF